MEDCMEASKAQKFERCIKLTESSNDHEALSALRIAQTLCKNSGVHFSDYLLKNKSSHTSSSEVQSLKKEVAYLNIKYSNLYSRHEFLALQHQALQKEYEKKTKSKKPKKKNSSEKDPVLELQNLKRKHKKLQEEYEELEEEQEHLYNRSRIIDELFDGTDEDREEALVEMVREFIANKYINISGSSWTSSTSLYKSFLDTCFDIKVMSSKKFSQIFSSILKIKPIKGGELKNLMGFSVSVPRGF